MSFADACGAADAARAAACEGGAAAASRDEGIELVRIGWCDTARHPARQDPRRRGRAEGAADGIGMVSTILLKDTSDRTAYRVFEPGATDALARLRLRQQPAAAARPGQLSRPAVGARHRLDARRGLVRGRRRRCRSTPGASCSRRSIASPGGLRPELRARGRVPHLSPRRSAARCRVARPGARRLAGRAAGDDDDPSRLQPARRRLGRSRRRAPAHRPAHRRRASACRCLARDRARAEPGRGGVRRRRDALTAADHMVALPQRRDARRCAAPATTPASSAGRRSRT